MIFSAPLTRRAFLGVASATLAAPLHAASRDFSFAVLSDLHYRDARCGEWLQRVAAHLRASRPRPDFVVLAGDLADEGSVAQLGAVREIFGALPMPVQIVIGNHDYSVDNRRENFERTFGPRRNYRFAWGDYQFLVLDSTQGLSVYRTRISTETLGWLEGQLPFLSREKPLVVLTHLPLGRNWLRPVNAYEVLRRLEPFEFRASFSGHWHGLTERVEHGVSLSTGRCCSWWRTNHDGSDLRGYTLCHAGPQGIAREFVSVPIAAL